MACRLEEWVGGYSRRSGSSFLGSIPGDLTTLPIQPHCSASQGECSLIRSISAKPFRSDKYTDFAEKMMEGEKEIKFQLVQEEL